MIIDGKSHQLSLPKLILLSAIRRFTDDRIILSILNTDIRTMIVSRSGFTEQLCYSLCYHLGLEYSELATANEKLCTLDEDYFIIKCVEKLPPHIIKE